MKNYLKSLTISIPLVIFTFIVNLLVITFINLPQDFGPNNYCLSSNFKNYSDILNLSNNFGSIANIFIVIFSITLPIIFSIYLYSAKNLRLRYGLTHFVFVLFSIISIFTYFASRNFLSLTDTFATPTIISNTLPKLFIFIVASLLISILINLFITVLFMILNKRKLFIALFIFNFIYAILLISPFIVLNIQFYLVNQVPTQAFCDLSG